ncbi:hypothetical protein [Flavobacterium sp.]|uniref:hypothetical protein n=1 Tax=Flavobacterium sp. TaxID=239 RepID=UPI0008D6E561|nr:hypothetical protein [Flavobacterium sp.]OGS60394.1 MAG: hypothetical protein A2X07_05600 [Flavobacteria bacterium GWF1_32_7]HBD25440.1 hypothetical protein [Flavobacterium sp.]
MNKTETKKLSEIISKPEISFDSIFSKEIKLHKFIIECSKLEEPDYNMKDLGYVKSVNPIIRELMQIVNPCIYWFEADNEFEADEMMGDLNTFRNKKIGRTIPPKNKNYGGKCLYLGVRQGGMRKKGNFSFIAGRISIHLGYYHVNSTQGLNLVYWANHNVVLNVLELPQESSIYLNLLEKLLASQMKPLCGRH